MLFGQLAPHNLIGIALHVSLIPGGLQEVGRHTDQNNRNILLLPLSFTILAAFSGCKESRVQQPGASGFCDRASEFCA